MEQRIVEFVSSYKNKKKTQSHWRKPVVGVADVRDPLFGKLKEIVGGHHALPTDIVPGARSVIAFFIPYGEEIVQSNIAGLQTSKAWDIAYIETNGLIVDLSTHLYECLTHMGHQSSLLPPTYNYDEEKLTSDWSHRSVSYIAGLGTFGIHNLMITDQGCCGRFGSVITTMDLTPTLRPVREHCLYKRNGSCKICLKRCIADAFNMGEKGEVNFDNSVCNKQIYDREIPIYDIGMGDTCGKCMVGLPCSTESP